MCLMKHLSHRLRLSRELCSLYYKLMHSISVLAEGKRSSASTTSREFSITSCFSPILRFIYEKFYQRVFACKQFDKSWSRDTHSVVCRYVESILHFIIRINRIIIQLRICRSYFNLCCATCVRHAYFFRTFLWYFTSFFYL